MKQTDPRLIPEDLWRLIRAIDTALNERDPYTHNHSHRLIQLCTVTAGFCDLPEGDIKLLQMSAALHDIGKIGIPDNVLQKPAKLETDEWEIIKGHSGKGERIVKKIQFEHCHEVAATVRHHHEQFNGSGYPDGLKGEDIPFLSRIITVCDGYDAMTTTRVYAKAKSHENAMTILHEEEGEKSDPYVFRNFVRAIGNGSDFTYN